MYGHGPEKKDTDNSTTEASSDTVTDHSDSSHHEINYEGTVAPFNTFPTLHPLIVHFPIVFLIVAFILQILYFIFKNNSTSWSVLIFITAGAITGIIAAFLWHPHPAELTPRMHEIFETHEHYAFWTIGLAAAALVVKALSHFFFNRKLFVEVIVLLLLIGCTYTVSMAGHLGSQMVHIEDIGPKGRYLETHH